MTNMTLANDLKGLNQLSREGFIGITEVTESLHQSILSLGGVIDKKPKARGLTGFVYRSVRFVAERGFQSADWAIERLSPLLPTMPASQQRLRWLSMLNGVLGDHLVASDNPLAMPMGLVKQHQILSTQESAYYWSQPTQKPVLMVHGLCLNEQCWQGPGRQADALNNQGDYAPLYLRYNTGLAIAENGRQLSALLNQLCQRLPVNQTMDIIAHSMGGLVVRSALQAAYEQQFNWPQRVDKVVFLGTPHQGALLEKAGHIADYLMDVSPYSRPFATMTRRRSQGIQDLKDGRVRDNGRLNAIPPHIQTHAIAAKLRDKGQNLVDDGLGDGLVSVASALGQHRKNHRDLMIAKDRQWVMPKVSHMGLLTDFNVQQLILKILSAKT